MKKVLPQIFILFFLVIFPVSKVNAENITTQMIQQEKETFGISSFIDETQKYTNDFFEDMNISEVLNSAITGKIDNNRIQPRGWVSAKTIEDIYKMQQKNNEAEIDIEK